MILKKLSLSQEQIDTVKELVSKKVSGRRIAQTINVSQPILWRNMELLGINNKKKKIPQKPEPQKEYFDWDDYKGDYYFFTS